MNKEQQDLALRLIDLLKQDTNAQDSTVVYGDWTSHLMDQLADELEINWEEG